MKGEMKRTEREREKRTEIREGWRKEGLTLQPGWSLTEPRSCWGCSRSLRWLGSVPATSHLPCTHTQAGTVHQPHTTHTHLFISQP